VLAIEQLAKLEEKDLLQIVKELLRVTPNPDCESLTNAVMTDLRNTLVQILLPGTKIEISPKFIDMAKTVLHQPQQHWTMDVFKEILEEESNVNTNQ